MMLPKASDEQKTNLFNRANKLRRQNEFGKAQIPDICQTLLQQIADRNDMVKAMK